jgi:small-conductance mechanosensitive channel
MNPNLVQSLFAQLTAPHVLGQLMAVLLAVGVAIAAGYTLRHWWQARAAALDGTAWQTRAAKGAAIISPIVLALLLVLVARAIFAAQQLPTNSLDIAMQLITALILVRLAVYLLRLVLGEHSWLRGYETKLTIAVWLVISFQLVGWFSAIENALDAIDLLPGKATFSVWDLLKLLFVVTTFVLITSLVARAIERRVMTLSSVALSTRIGVSKFAHVVLISLGVLLGIRSAGVDLTVLTVFTGAIGLGLGFGLQSIASNFVSGFVLLMDRSIKPGDVISFTGHTGTSTENFGWVQELRGRYVVVRDRDGVDTLVPNQHLINNPVINWSYADRRVRLKLPVRLSYRDDPEEALQVLLQAAAGNARILHEPAPVSRLMQFGDSGMDLELRFWISDPENGVNNVRSEVNRAIWRLFKQHNLTIPVTQSEVVVRGPDLLARQ